MVFTPSVIKIVGTRIEGGKTDRRHTALTGEKPLRSYDLPCRAVHVGNGSAQEFIIIMPQNSPPFQPFFKRNGKQARYLSAVSRRDFSQRNQNGDVHSPESPLASAGTDSLKADGKPNGSVDAGTAYGFVSAGFPLPS